MWTNAKGRARRMVWAALLAVVGLGVTFVATARADPDWLNTINYWRAEAGVGPVTDQPSWDQGITNHLIYLEKTPPSEMTGQYASAHTENPASPYYTQSGATEAADSDLDEGGASSDETAIDGWLSAPFHAIGMLRAQLTQVAFAIDSGDAGLDVIQGLDESLPAATTPILFPGPGSTTTLTTASSDEEPSPLETCGWQNDTVGLPIIALLPQSPEQGLSATLNGPGGTESTASGSLCVVDENTYHSSDSVYGPTGEDILEGDNAVLLIPAQPLVNGSYSVDIQQSGDSDITWSFDASVPAPVNTNPPDIVGSDEVGGQLDVEQGKWTGDPSSYTDQWLRCDSAGNDCQPISGATGLTYTPTSADQGSTIEVAETATNSGGTSAATTSAATAVIAAPPDTTGSSTPPGRACRGTCLSARHPFTLVLPRTARPGHPFELSFGGVQVFDASIVIRSRTGHVIWRYVGTLHAGLWNFRLAFGQRATGGRISVTATLRSAAARTVLTGTVRY